MPREHALDDQAGQLRLEGLRLRDIVLDVIGTPPHRRRRVMIVAAGVDAYGQAQPLGGGIDRPVGAFSKRYVAHDKHQDLKRNACPWRSARSPRPISRRSARVSRSSRAAACPCRAIPLPASRSARGRTRRPYPLKIPSARRTADCRCRKRHRSDRAPCAFMSSRLEPGLPCAGRQSGRDEIGEFWG